MDSLFIPFVDFSIGLLIFYTYLLILSLFIHLLLVSLIIKQNRALSKVIELVMV